MQAVVLAAGEGTRLQPLTDDKPKVLVEVNGTPLIEDVFDNLIDAGASELIVVVGYKAEQIIDRYGDEYRDVPITYTHQREQLGLAHAILQAEPHVDGDFFLSGTGINMAPRSLLLEVPYYDLGGAEDRDFWRRLYARDALIWLDHGPVSDQIGYQKTLRDRISRDVHGKICDFQSGISFWSTIAYTIYHEHFYILEERRSPPVEFVKRLYDFVTYPYAYLKALGGHRHEAPSEFRKRGALERRIAETRRTLPELEAEYGFRIDRDALSPAGREAYLPD